MEQKDPFWISSSVPLCLYFCIIFMFSNYIVSFFFFVCYEKEQGGGEEKGGEVWRMKEKNVGCGEKIRKKYDRL